MFDQEKIIEQAMLDDTPSTDDPALESERFWLQIAAESWRESTSYWDSSLRREIEHSLALFQLRHPPGSKYNTDAFKNRARGVRGKTRAAVRRHEAAAAAAFFSTDDIVTCEAGNPNDKVQRLAAAVNQALLQHRLEKTIPWFQILMGAYQSAMTAGAVCSKQYWRYEEREVEVEYEDGTTETTVEVISDRPVVELHPLENVRFHPGADWTDPVNSSPFFIVLHPMPATDVMAMVERSAAKVLGPKFRDVDLETIITHGQIHNSADGSTDSTSRARDGQTRQDRYDLLHGTRFQTVWLREYFVRIDGDEYVFWTLGDGFLLSDPVPLREVYLQGRRPMRLGVCLIEAHKALPQSLVYLNRHNQAAADEVRNSRFDNVRLVLNKRKYVRKGAQIDLAKLSRSTPGGVVMMDNFDDIKEEQINDVTGSAYAEQDRVDVDFDEISGSFSGSSVMANRKLNETVGGMQLLNSSADAVTEYQLRTFSETWVQPVLQDLCYLEQAYETDETVMALAADKAEVWQQLRELNKSDMDFNDLLVNHVTVTVNVGMGSTNPVERVNKFMMGIQAMAGLPSVMARANEDEIANEIWGRLGYRDGSRFIKSEDEMGEPPPNLEMLKLQQEDQHFQAKLALDREMALMDMAMKFKLTLAEIKSRLGIDKYKADTAAQSVTVNTTIRERGRLMSEQNRSREMDLKRQMGSGI